MATTLQQPVVAVDLRGVVDNAIENVRAARNLRAIKIETEFQRQVAEGLSYDAQIEYLQSELERETNSSFSSKDIVGELTKRIADTKRLKRFNAYRTRYQDILAELKAGKSNAQQQLGQLKGLLDSVGDDEELRLEIQGDITAMETEVKQAEDTMIQNQLKRAQYDGTEKVLNEALTMVKDKRSKSLLQGLEDEASAYDVWITVLNKQLNEVKVVNQLNDIDVRVNTKGLTAQGKVDELNDIIRKADRNTSITIDGVTYDSAQEYWTNTRDAYLAGTGSGLFSDFFKELDGEYTERINASVKRDGLVTTVVFDRIQSEFDNLKGRSEFKPFLERLTDYEAIVQGTALESTAASIIDRVSITGDYKGADRALQSYAQKYNVNVDSYRMQLSAQAEQRAIALYEASDGKISLDDARKRLGVDTILTPEDPGFQTPNAATPKNDLNTPEADRAAAGATSRFAGAAGYSGASIVDFLSMAGQDSSKAARAALAAERGIQNYTGSAQQNTQLLNMLKQEAATPPARTPEPAPAPAAKTNQNTPAPKTSQGADTKKQQTTSQTKTPTQPAPTPKAPTPVATTPAKTNYDTSYTGVSIVDFLSRSGQDSSKTNRAKLAAEQGISNYQGTAEQNTQLLKKLRGF